MKIKHLVVAALTIAAMIVLSWFLWRIPEAHAAEIGSASWYSTEACTETGKKIYTKDCLTASGRSLYELEKNKVDFAAMWKVPFNSRFRVTNVKSGKSVDVLVLDRGPSKKLSRVCDLSKSAFQKIADLRDGIIKVRIERIP